MSTWTLDIPKIDADLSLFVLLCFLCVFILKTLHNIFITKKQHILTTTDNLFGGKQLKTLYIKLINCQLNLSAWPNI